MAFSIFDYDDDGMISELDLYSFIKIYEYEEEMFREAFQSDLATMSSAIQKKKHKKGLINMEYMEAMRPI